MKAETRKDLEEIVEEAIRFLAPKFGVNDEELKKMKKPKVKVCEKLAYNIYKNEIKLKPDARYIEIGEEVGHWFHCQLNNPIKKDMNAQERAITLFLSQFVGRYAGIIYASEKKEEIKFEALQLLQELEVKDEKDVQKENKFLLEDDFINVLGYSAAEEVFLKYGDRLLGDAARLSLEEIKEIIDQKIQENGKK